MEWQFWLLVVWALGLGYTIGRAHSYHLQYKTSVKKSKDDYHVV